MTADQPPVAPEVSAVQEAIQAALAARRANPIDRFELCRDLMAALQRGATEATDARDVAVLRVYESRRMTLADLAGVLRWGTNPSDPQSVTRGRLGQIVVRARELVAKNAPREDPPVENMTITVEVWPVAVDAAGVWLLWPDALRADLPVPADSDPLAECKLLLARRGIDQTHLIEIHGTSTRTDGPVLLATHYATVDCPGPVIEHWPHAQPIDLTLAQSVGQAPSHRPTDIPTPRDIDVLLHALRHLWARLGYDQDAIDTYADRPLWATHLQSLAPALARMYGAEYRPVA